MFFCRCLLFCCCQMPYGRRKKLQNSYKWLFMHFIIKRVKINFKQLFQSKLKISSSYHSHQDAWGEGHLVECSEGPSQVCGGHFLDVERIKTHHQAAEETEQQPSQDEDLKWLAGFGGGHQTRSHHRETVHNEDGVTPGGKDERNEKTKWLKAWRKLWENNFFSALFTFRENLPGIWLPASPARLRSL